MAEQNSVDVFVRLGFWEAYRAAFSVTARTFRKLLYIWSAAATIAVVLFIFAWAHPAPNHEWFETLQNSKPLYWAFAFPLILVFGLPLLSARALVSNERSKRGFRYTFSPMAILIEGPISKAELQWKAIIRAIETPTSFLLFRSAYIAHTVPKRCFDNPSDIDALRELVRTNIADVKLRG